MSFLVQIGKFIVSNLDTIKVFIGFIATAISTGLGILWQKKREDQKNTKVKEIVAKGGSATEDEIKIVSKQNKNNGVFKFIINNLMLIGICYFIHYLFNQILKNPLFEKDIEFLKNILMVKIVFFLFIGILIATRIASSITSFDSILKGLPIIKKFVK